MCIYPIGSANQSFKFLQFTLSEKNIYEEYTGKTGNPAKQNFSGEKSLTDYFITKSNIINLKPEPGFQRSFIILKSSFLLYNNCSFELAYEIQ